MIRTLYALLLSALFASGLHAHDYMLKEVHISHPYAATTVAAQTTGAAYLSLENNSKQTIKLIGASSVMATRIGLHQMSVENNIARMRQVPAIEVKPGEALKMVPGMGYHLMLVGLKRPLGAGDKFPMILEFADLGKIEVSIVVQNAKEGMMGH